MNGERAAELTRLAAALDAERERNEHAAVVAERTRIAREVHDAVAHSVSVMTLQLGGLRRRLRRSGEAAGRWCTAWSGSAAQSVRRDARAGRHPARQRQRRTPAPAAVAGPGRRAGGRGPGGRSAGRARPWSASCRRAAPAAGRRRRYRVLQEALTNVLRHAGAAPTPRDERLRRTASRITVSDDGPGSATPARAGPPAPASGHGLRRHLRERVADPSAGCTADGAGRRGGFRGPGAGSRCRPGPSRVTAATIRVVARRRRGDDPGGAAHGARQRSTTSRWSVRRPTAREAVRRGRRAPGPTWC